MPSFKQLVDLEEMMLCSKPLLSLDLREHNLRDPREHNLREQSQDLMEHNLRELCLREQNLRDLREQSRDLREQSQREQNLRDLREQSQREQSLRDLREQSQDLREQSLREQSLREQSQDLREQSLREQSLREPPLLPLSAAMRTPGYTGQPRKEALFSSSTSSLFSSSPHLSVEPSDAAYLSPCQWGQQSDGALPSRLPNSTRWSKPGFWAERSLSMVETSSSAHTLGWPGTETKPPFACPAALSAGSLAASSSSSAASLLSPSSSSSSPRYKTEMCRTFAESGGCKYGSKCQFAHGYDELRDLSRHPKYKTEPCRTFHTVGFCPYGIRCHFMHNNEEEEEAAASRAAPAPPPRRPPLLKQSFSFAGFPSAPQALLQPPPSFFRSPSPPACALLEDLLSHALLQMDSAFAASPGPQPDPRAQFLPSPDSGCSLSGLSPASSPPSGPQGSLSRASLSDPEREGSSAGSSTSSLSGSESCGAADGRRLAVFSQLSVPDDIASFFL